MKLSIGQQAARELTVTAEMVRVCADITGAFKPLHFDEEFTARTRFKRLLAQGCLITGLWHALVAIEMPGLGSVFVQQTWSIPRPVYIGDTIRGEATVKSVRERRGMAKLDFTVVN